MEGKSPAVTTSASWQEDIINGYLEFGATFVSEEEYQRRLSICKKCPKFGLVTLPGGRRVDGCTECGCPATTKPRVLKYFNPLKLKTIKVDCPDELWGQPIL